MHDLPRKQFRVLYRAFSRQIIDLEWLPSREDPSVFLTQLAGLLAAAGLILAILILLPYVRYTSTQIAESSWGDLEFLVSTTMAVAGMFTVLAWDSIFPAHRDALTLGALPLRARTIFRAKTAAIGTGLGIALMTLNAATGLAYPLVVGGLRALAAYWFTTLAAGLFVFCGLLAAQGLAALLFSYRRFLKISNALQLVAFFLVLGVYFLTPGRSELVLTSDSGIPPLCWRLPSFWWVGLFQQMSGASRPLFAPLAGHAWIGLTVAVVLAAGTFTLSYFRNIRRIIEEPDITPSDRRHPARRWPSVLVGRCFELPLERAVILFMARTLVRSRQHRNLAAAFGGLGLAISLAFAKGMLYGQTRMYSLARAYGFQPPHWYKPNHAMMAAGFIMLTLALIGTRTAFAVPATLKANWIFQITAIHSPKAYFTAIRKAMITTIAAPVCLVAAVFYLVAWRGFEPAAHAAVLTAVAVILVYRQLTGFRKLPFACSYLPGTWNFHTKLPLYGVGFLFLVDVGTRIERGLFETGARTTLLAVLLAGLWLRSRARWRAFAAEPLEELQFEDEPAREIAPLDLSHSEAYRRTYRYVDVLNTAPERGLRQRALVAVRRTAMITTGLCVAGFFYEQVSRLRSPLAPRVGQSVDIGGRSLNYDCLGQGSPAVIFESGRGEPGMEWTPFQLQIATYTRACWYDRAGYGWSDAAPFPHPASAIADDLHRLLTKASVAPPYVLVGFSFGGICVRVFTQRYPSDVVGLVLIDSTHIDNREPITPIGGGYLPYFPRLVPALAQILRPIGVVRLGMPREEITPFEPRTMVESVKEMDYESLLEARAVRDLGDRPLIVLTAGRHRISPPDNLIDASAQQAWEARWAEAQQQLAHLSTRGEQRIFSQASHNLPRDRPQDVLDAILQVVNDVRMTN